MHKRGTGLLTANDAKFRSWKPLPGAFAQPSEGKGVNVTMCGNDALTWPGVAAAVGQATLLGFQCFSCGRRAGAATPPRRCWYVTQPNPKASCRGCLGY
jgi:hypothetical protein